MESRMDKYYKSDISDCSRSKRNSKLYKDIYGDYSNLERLPISENSSEINMSDLNKMISSREEYKKAKQDLIQAARSIQKLSFQQQQMLAEELFGAANVMALSQILCQHLR